MGFFDERTADVPENIDAIVEIDIKSEVDPGKVGLNAGDIDEVWGKTVQFYRSGMHPAIVLCIRKQGQVILHRSIGHARGNGPGDESVEKELVHPQTPVCVFSASKSISAMLVHLLHEQGLLSIHDTVAKHIPEFGQNGKEKITIEMVLSHRSGVRSFPDDIMNEKIFDHDFLLKELCKQPLNRAYVDASAYHATTGGYILAEIVKRASGKDMKQLLREHITGPLGFDVMDYGSSNPGLVAKNYATGREAVFPVTNVVSYAIGGTFEKAVELSDRPEFYRVISPSANIVATADEMSQFFQLLLNGGELNGVRVFSRETVKRATRETGNVLIDRSLLIPMRYSAGMMLGNRPFGMFGPDSYESFGHLGLINILCWADRKRQLSVALLNTGKPLFSGHLIDFANLLSSINSRL